MFTGLVQSVGMIKTIRKDADYLHLAIASDFDLNDIKIGESISCDGACLTVTKISGKILEVAASQETADKTILANYRTGSSLNLERALAVGDRLGGHYVTGHIDTRGKILAEKPVGKSIEITVGFDTQFDKMVVPKGSIAINGVSLTVNEVSSGKLSVNIIPHTMSATTITDLKAGTDVNLEFDLIGKYVMNFKQPYIGQPLTEKKLKESGW